MLKKHQRTIVGQERCLNEGLQCNYVVGKRLLPTTVARLSPEKVISVSPLIICERIQVIRRSKAKRVSKALQELERVMYPAVAMAAETHLTVIRVIDSDNIAMRVSDVKSFFEKITDLPRISFKDCTCAKCSSKLR